MRYEIVTTHRFEKAFKRCRKRGYPMEALRVVLNLLAENGSLQASIDLINYQDSLIKSFGSVTLNLTGYWSGNRIIIKR